MGVCVPGKTVLEACEFGDKRLSEETFKVYKKEKEMKKGVLIKCCLLLFSHLMTFDMLDAISEKNSKQVIGTFVEIINNQRKTTYNNVVGIS